MSHRFSCTSAFIVLVILVGALAHGVEQPALLLNQSMVDFGLVHIGGREAAREVVVTNQSNRKLSLTAMRVPNAPFFVEGARLPLSLGAGETATFSLICRPTAVADAMDSLVLGTSDPLAPVLRIALQAETRNPPSFSLAPSQPKFIMLVGQSGTQTVTLTNPGGSPLEWSARFIGRSSQVPQLAISPSSGVVPAGGSVPLSITVAGIGYAFGSLLDVDFSTNIPLPNGTTYRSTLYATLDVVSALSSASAVTAIDFGYVVAGQSKVMDLPLVNGGPMPFDVTAIRLPSAAFSWVTEPVLPMTVAGRSSQTLQLRYSPMLTEDLAVNLELDTTASVNPRLNVAVTGKGRTLTSWVATPASLAVLLTKGRSRRVPVHIANTGADLLEWHAELLTTRPAASAAVARVPSKSVTLSTSTGGYYSGGLTVGGGIIIGTGGTIVVKPYTPQIRVALGSTDGVVAPGQTDRIEVLAESDSDYVPWGVSRWLRLTSTTGQSQVVPITVYQTSGATLVVSTPDFGTTHVGESRLITLGLRNGSDAPLTITGLTLPDSSFSLETDSFPIALAPGANNATVQVRYRPTAPTTSSAPFIVSSNDPLEPEMEVPTKVKAIAPALFTAQVGLSGTLDLDGTASLPLTFYHFGQQAVSWTASLTSDTDAPLASAVQLVSAGGQLSANSTGSSTGAQATLVVQATAGTLAAQQYHGTIELRTVGDGYLPLRVPLTLTVRPKPRLRIEDPTTGTLLGSQFDFGRVPVATAASRIIRLRNTGNADLMITGNPFIYNGATMTLDQTWPLTLCAGAFADVTVSLAASPRGGAFGGTTFTTNEPSTDYYGIVSPTSSVWFQYVANVYQPARMEVSPTALTMLVTSNTIPAAQTLTFTNTSDEAVTLQSPQYSANNLLYRYGYSDTYDYGWTGPSVLAAGQSVTLYLHPAALLNPAGDRLMTVTVPTSSSLTPSIVVPITIQVPPRATGYISGNTTFPLTTRGATSSLNVVVTNNGTAPLVITGASFDQPSFSTTATFPITVAIGASTSLPLTFTPVVGPVSQRCTMRLLSNSPDTVPFSNYSSQPTGGTVFSVYLNGQTTATHVLGVLPAALTGALSLTARSGEATTIERTLTVYNNTASSLNADVLLPDASTAGWLSLPTGASHALSISSSGGTISQRVMIQPGNLLPGKHQATVAFRPRPPAVGQDVVVPVELNILPADFELTSATSLSLFTLAGLPPQIPLVHWQLSDGVTPASITVRSTQPWLHVALQPDGQSAQLTVDASVLVSRYEANTAQMVLETANTVRVVNFSLTVDDAYIMSLAADASSDVVYALYQPGYWHRSQRMLARYRVSTGQVDATLAMPSGAKMLAYNPVHNVLHVAGSGSVSGFIASLRASDLSLLGTDAVSLSNFDNDSFGMAVNPEGILILTGGLGADFKATVQAYDYAAHKVIAEYSSPRTESLFGSRLALSASGRQLWLVEDQRWQYAETWLTSLEFENGAFKVMRSVRNHALIQFPSSYPLYLSADEASLYIGDHRFNTVKLGQPAEPIPGLSYESQPVVLSADRRLIASQRQTLVEGLPSLGAAQGHGGYMAVFAAGDSRLVRMIPSSNAGYAFDALNLAKLHVSDAADSTAATLDETHALDFGQVVNGVPTTRTLRLRSIGGTTLTGLGTLRFGGRDAASLSVLVPPSATRLTVGTETRCQVRLRPTATGVSEAWVEVLSSDATHPAYRIALQWDSSATALAPTIVMPPASQVGELGDTVTFSVTATGSGSLRYTWYHDGRLILGERQAQLTLERTALEDAGHYQVRVSNSVGTVISEAAQMIVSTHRWIGIEPIVALEGRTLRLASKVTPPANAELVWERDGVALTDGLDSTGSASSVLSLRTISARSAGRYQLIFITAAGRLVLADYEVSLTLLPHITTSLLGPWTTNGRPIEILTSATPVARWSARGLPPGITLDPTSGLLLGSATAAGSYNVGITAVNAAGSDYLTLAVQVAGAPSLSGKYVALFSRSADNDEMGEHLQLVIAAGNTFTGSWRGPRHRAPIKGRLLWDAPLTQAQATVVLNEGAQLSLAFTSDGTCSGGIATSNAFTPFMAERVGSPVRSWLGNYNAAIQPGYSFDTKAEGAGFLQIKMSASGAASLTGRLNDGVAFTAAASLTTHDYLLVYLQPFGVNIRDSAFGLLGFSTAKGPASEVLLDGDFSRRSFSLGSDPSIAQRLYPQMPLHTLTITGGLYRPPPRGELVLNLSTRDHNATLEFNYLPPQFSPLSTFESTITGGTCRMADNALGLSFQINPATGLFQGGMLLDDPFIGGVYHRNGSFRGLIVPRLGLGLGYYYLPEIAARGTEPGVSFSLNQLTLRPAPR